MMLCDNGWWHRSTTSVVIDAELPVEDLSKALVRDIERMGPFGHMNPEPRFLALNLTVGPRTQDNPPEDLYASLRWTL